MYSYGPPHIAEEKQDDQLEHTYSSYVRIRDVALKTCRRRLTIGRSGERGSRISVQAARHDDNEDDDESKLTEKECKGSHNCLGKVTHRESCKRMNLWILFCGYTYGYIHKTESTLKMRRIKSSVILKYKSILYFQPKDKSKF